MKKSGIKQRRCTNDELKEELSSCPEIIEELTKLSVVSLGDWIDLFDSLLYKHGISFGIAPVYKGNSETILYYGYWYSIDGEITERFDCKGIKSFAEAQLQAVHDMMYRLRERL